MPVLTWHLDCLCCRAYSALQGLTTALGTLLEYAACAALAAGLRHVRPAAKLTLPACSPDKVYIITGGLGGFGLAVSEFLGWYGAKKIVITSKRGVRNGSQEAALQELWFQKIDVRSLLLSLPALTIWQVLHAKLAAALDTWAGSGTCSSLLAACEQAETACLPVALPRDCVLTPSLCACLPWPPTQCC